MINSMMQIPKKDILISSAGSRLLKINLMDTTRKLKPSGRKR